MDENRNYGPDMRSNGRPSSCMPSNGNYEFTTPPPLNFDTEEMRGSIQKILSENIGEYVVIEFLIGTTLIMRKQGCLYYVGNSYVTLYDDQSRNFLACDIFSIKFVYFYFPGDRPKFNYNLLPPSSQSNNSNNRIR